MKLGSGELRLLLQERQYTYSAQGVVYEDGKIGTLTRTITLPPVLQPYCGKEIEGACLEVRAGTVFGLEGEGVLLSNMGARCTPSIVPLKLDNYPELGHPTESEVGWYLTPHRYYLVTTVEKIFTPPDLLAHAYPRTTLQRCGVILTCTSISPAYEGILTFGIENRGGTDFFLARNARIAMIEFEELKEQELSAQYRGQWQGGRVACPEGEKQQ